MIDTVGGFIERKIDTSQLTVEKGWKRIKVEGKPFLSCYFFNNDIIRIWYYPLTKRLNFITNLPKMLYGTNSRMIFNRHLKKINVKFKNLMIDILGFSLPDLFNWFPSRIDFCWNFKAKVAQDVLEFIHVFGKAQKGRYKTIQFDTTSWHKNKSAQYKLYSKYHEMIAREDHGHITEEDKLKVRYEIQLNRDKIVNLYGKYSKIGDIINEKEATKVLNDCLKDVNCYGAFLKKDDMFEKIRKAYPGKMGDRLIEFVCYINEKGINCARKTYTKTKYIRYTEKLKQIEITNLFYLIHAHPIVFEVKVIKRFIVRRTKEIYSSELLNMNNIVNSEATVGVILDSGHSMEHLTNAIIKT
ncbi:hypothetical protein N752_29550 [Desulforamulus aquiferis]|nr:hypothetical protein [Desulforamulus aquiferis]RYD01723.1 hypothetical protein N752_29550 [Desulforamulus aquiferis]